MCILSLAVNDPTSKYCVGLTILLVREGAEVGRSRRPDRPRQDVNAVFNANACPITGSHCE